MDGSTRFVCDDAPDVDVAFILGEDQETAGCKLNYQNMFSFLQRIVIKIEGRKSIRTTRIHWESTQLASLTFTRFDNQSINKNVQVSF